jgi:hypothetical protein
MAHAEDKGAGTIVAMGRILCDDMKKHNVIRAGAVVGCGSRANCQAMS